MIVPTVGRNILLNIGDGAESAQPHAAIVTYVHNDRFQQHWVDVKGMPTGGVSTGRGFCVSWQNGPLGRGEQRVEPNGAFVEDVLQAVIDRIEHYQASPFACKENAQALAYLLSAARALDERTKERETRQVEGTHEK